MLGGARIFCALEHGVRRRASKCLTTTTTTTTTTITTPLTTTPTQRSIRNVRNSAAASFGSSSSLVFQHYTNLQKTNGVKVEAQRHFGSQVGMESSRKKLGVEKNERSEIGNSSTPLQELELSEKNWKEHIEENIDCPVIVHCTAHFAEDSCNKLGSFLKNYWKAGEGHVQFGVLDVVANFDLAERLNINVLPAAYGFVRGRAVHYIKGLYSEEDVQEFVATMYNHSNYSAIPAVGTHNNNFPLDERKE